MFGVGPQKLLIMVLFLLVVFASAKVMGVTKNLARSRVEEFKDKLLEGGRNDYGSASDPRSDR